MKTSSTDKVDRQGGAVASHRFIRCTLSRAVVTATAIHRQALVDDHQQGRRALLHWQSQLPGNLIIWTLEMEQGANGVLAHLSGEAASGPLTLLTSRLRRVALHPLSARELSALAALAVSAPYSPDD